MRKERKRKDYLFDIVWIQCYLDSRHIDCIGEDRVHRHSAEEDDGERAFGGTDSGAPARLKNDAENEGVYAEHHERMDDVPEDTEDGALIL